MCFPQPFPPPGTEWSVPSCLLWGFAPDFNGPVWTPGPRAGCRTHKALCPHGASLTAPHPLSESFLFLHLLLPTCPGRNEGYVHYCTITFRKENPRPVRRACPSLGSRPLVLRPSYAFSPAALCVTHSRPPGSPGRLHGTPRIFPREAMPGRRLWPVTDTRLPAIHTARTPPGTLSFCSDFSFSWAFPSLLPPLTEGPCSEGQKGVPGRSESDTCAVFRPCALGKSFSAPCLHFSVNEVGRAWAT